MNPYCGAGMTVSISEIAETCLNACDGSALISVSNGQQPFSYVWSNGNSTESATDLCPGNYTVEVIGSNGCSVTETFTIQAGITNPTTAIQSAGPYLETDQTEQLLATPSGGTWSSDCGNCISSNGIFSPQNAGVGSFNICYSVGSDNCSDQDCITIIVIEDCQPQLTSETITICPGDSILIFNDWESIAGSYSGAFIDVNGCDSTHMIELSNFDIEDQYELFMVCETDSIEVFGIWVYNDTVLEQLNFTVNGCKYAQVAEVSFNNCELEPFVIYVPNVFTPNNDLINDTFAIQILGGLVEVGYILNRWGEVIYQFDSENISWDGRDMRSGAQVQDGVYTYLIYFKPAEAPRDKIHGFVSVIR
jgi:gliding motility-associated-like protein